MEAVAICVTLGMLSFSAWQDVRTRSVPVLPLLLVLTAGLLSAGWRDARATCAGALLPGGLLLIMTPATGGRIGSGDGLTLLALGAWNSPETVWHTLIAALAAGGLWALGLLTAGKGKETSFPFLPFLLAGFLLSLLFSPEAAGFLNAPLPG